MNGVPLWFQEAMKERGVHETPGSDDNPVILRYWREAGIQGGTSENIAWCAVFTNAMLARAGVKGTGSALAKSFLKWGVAVREPTTGCIVVIDRGNDPSFGHVGMFVKKDDEHVWILGGNQGDAVSIAAFPLSRKPRYRLPAIDLGEVTLPEPPPPPPKLDPAEIDAAVDGLRENGSRTIQSADQIETVAKGGFFGALFTKLMLILSEYVPDAETVTHVLDWVLAHWYVFAAGYALYVLSKTKSIKLARAEDALKGLNIGRSHDVAA